MTEYYSPVTQDMLQLIRFENVYICGDPSSEGLSFYLEQNSSEECVVYIDTDGFWSSGFNPQEMLESLLALTDYSDYIHLYKYGNSDTYLLVY